MTTFHLKADMLDQSFLERLRSLFAHKEIDIFVRESSSNGAGRADAGRADAGRADGITRLIAHPFGVKNFHAPTKDEIHSRN